MNELVELAEKAIGVNLDERFSVSAREVWYFLESKQDFSTWIKKRIKTYSFQESVDYTLHKTVERVKGHRGGGSVTSDEYNITIEMAKHLCLVEKTEKGHATRQYFIAVEQKARELLDSTAKDKKLMLESKETRKAFTELLKECGANNPMDYIIPTLETKRCLLIPLNHPKEKYNKAERLQTTATESIAAIISEKLHPSSPKEVKNIITDAANRIYDLAHDGEARQIPECYVIDTTLTPRKNLSKLVSYVAAVTEKGTERVWAMLYEKLSFVFGCNLYMKAGHPKSSVLDYLEQNHDMEMILKNAIRYFSQYLYKHKYLVTKGA